MGILPALLCLQPLIEASLQLQPSPPSCEGTGLDGVHEERSIAGNKHAHQIAPAQYLSSTSGCDSACTCV